MTFDAFKALALLLGVSLVLISLLCLKLLKILGSWITANSAELIKSGFRTWDLIPVGIARLISLAGILVGAIAIVLVFFSWFKISWAQ